jgi:hypothetical protein
MADCSQHPGQIMETQTRYDLNAAIESWRAELAVQANLTPEVRRELETHLRDAITGFQQRGLNDEESFWLACKRVGQPSQLAKEFVKANPAAVWRERIFWMWLALFLSSTLGGMGTSLVLAMMPLTHTQGLQIFFQSAPTFLPIIITIVAVILVAKGKLISLFSKPMPLVANRHRLAITAIICIAVSSAVRLVSMALYFSRVGIHSSQMPIWVWQSQTIYALIAGLILVWLLPPQSKTLRASRWLL